MHKSDSGTRLSSAPGELNSPPARKRIHLTLSQQERVLAYALLTPALLVVFALIAYPLYLAFAMSVREGGSFDLSAAQSGALTIDNYRDAITSPQTWQSVWRSMIYTVGSTAPAFVVGLGTAILLNEKFPGRRLARPALLLPWAIPGVAVSVIFLWMLDASYGVINSMLRQSGIISENIGWFISSDTAMMAVIVPTIWKYYPFFTLMLLAALQNVPQDLYEVAHLDGAGRLRRFTAVTWPGIRGAAVLSTIIGGLGIFREFDMIFPLTGGGPVRATETLVIGLYNEAFRYHDLPIASALGVITIVIAGIAVLSLGRQMRKEFF